MSNNDGKKKESNVLELAPTGKWDIPKQPSIGDIIKKFKKRDSLIIMGFASTSAPLAPIQDNKEFDIWGLNCLDALMPGAYTLMFNTHKSGIPEEHIAHMATSSLYTFMPKVHPSIPKSLEMPFQELIDMFGGAYFSCTAAWQIALAIAMSYKRIDLWGIDMTEDKEYAYERPCVEYYIGLARGFGIQVGIPDTSALCTCPFVYGVTDVDSRPWRRIETLVQQRIESVKRDIPQIDFNRGKAEGAKITLEFLLKAIQDNSRVFDIMERETSAANSRMGGMEEMLRLAETAAVEGAKAVKQGTVPPVMPTLPTGQQLDRKIEGAIREPGL